MRYIFVLLITFSLALPASAQGMQCGSREVVVNLISEKFKVERQAIALAQANAMVELWVAKNGRWVFTVMDVEGLMCVIAAGTDWEMLQPSKPGVEH